MGSRADAATTARLSLAGIGAPTSAEGIGEGRNFTPLGEYFEDAFEGYGVHLYGLR